MAGVKGRSGRLQKPVKQKLLAGNPGKKAININEPDFDKVVNVSPSDWLNETAKEMFMLLAPQLCKQKILCATDLHNLEFFCVAYANAKNSQLLIDKYGLTVGDKKNPASTTLNEAVKQMVSFGARLGLDPSSRASLTGVGQSKNNPFAKFVK